MYDLQDSTNTGTGDVERAYYYYCEQFEGTGTQMTEAVDVYEQMSSGECLQGAVNRA